MARKPNLMNCVKWNSHTNVPELLLSSMNDTSYYYIATNKISEKLASLQTLRGVTSCFTAFLRQIDPYYYLMSSFHSIQNEL